MASMIASVSALLLSVAFLMFGHGMQMTIVPIRAEIEMFSNLSIGLISSSFFVGFVAGSVFGPYLIVRAGHIRAFAALISLGSAAALAHPLFPDSYTWSIARIITGFCIAADYIIIESWLNERATNATRGVVMSAYTIIVYAGTMMGQFSSSIVDITGFEAFVISSIALSIAVVPVALTKSAQPAPVAMVRLRPKRLYATSPAAMVAVALVGVAVGALLSLLPIYGSRIGAVDSLIPFFGGAATLGGLILQYPLGRLSDKMDRRRLLIISAIFAIAVSVFLSFQSEGDTYVLIALIALLGGLVHPLYSMASAHAYDRCGPDEMVETAAGIMLVFGIGSIFGPLIASTMMDQFGPHALFSVVTAVLTIMVIFLLLRLNQNETVSDEDRYDYDLASAAPVGAVTAPDLFEGADDYVLVPEEYEPTIEDVDEDTTSELPYSDEEENEGTD